MRVKFGFVLKITLKLFSTQPWKQQANHMVSHHFCFLNAKNEGGEVGENDRGNYGKLFVQQAQILKRKLKKGISS